MTTNSNAAYCRLKGWGPGTKLIDKRGRDSFHLIITAIGEKEILVRCKEYSHIGEITWSFCAVEETNEF